MKDRFILFVFFVSIFFSCKKNDVFVNETYTINSVAENISHYNYIPVNSTRDSVLVDLGMSISGNRKYIGLPALLSEKAKEDGEVIARIDTSKVLIDIYDSIYNTKSPTLHGAMFRLANEGKLSFKSGDSQTLDSVKLEIANANLFPNNTNEVEYVVPVVFESVKGNLKSRLMYFRYKIYSRDYLSTKFKTYYNFWSDDSKVLSLTGLRNNFVLESVKKAGEPKLEVEVETAPIAIDAYNKVNFTNYKELPNSSFSFEKNFITIFSGSVFDTRAVSYKLTNLNVLDPNTDYIKIIKLKSFDGKSINAPFRFYVIVKSKNGIEASASSVNGSLIADKSLWKAKTSSTYTTSKVSYLVDGDFSTSWNSGSVTPHWIEVDLGKVESLNGFRMVPNYKYRNENILSMNVFESKDNIIWNFIGRYEGGTTLASSTVANPDFKYVKFLQPVSSRYYRFEVIRGTSGTYTGLNELDAYH